MEKIATNEQLSKAIQMIKWLKQVKVLKIIFRFESEWDIHFGAERNNARPIEIIYVQPRSNSIEHFIPYVSNKMGYAPSLIEYIYKGKNTEM